MRLISTLFVILLCHETFAQKTQFVSNVDQDMTIKAVTLGPLPDNVSGIYSKPLREHLNSLIQQDKQWSLKNYQETLSFQPEDFESKPETVKLVLKKMTADAVIAGRINQGPQGINIRLQIFSGKNGLLLSQAQLQNYSGFEINDLKSQMETLYRKVKKGIPYAGIILSRKGLLVTVDQGSRQGLTPDATLTVVQILKIQRHPKFNFVVGADKEILGKVKLKKVEENLSFGTITVEKEEGVIAPQQKFIVDNDLSYPETPMTAEGNVVPDLNQRSDSPVAFGDKAQEWVPETTPTFGKLGLLLGFSMYNMNANVATGGGLSASNSFAPTIGLEGEMWVTPQWFGAFSLKQIVFSVANPYAGSTPSKLNASAQQYSLLGGYNFLIAEDFWGPKIQLLAGLSNFKSYVDQSTPVAFTSQTYSGILFGLGGHFPLQLESKLPLSLGARLNFHWNPSMTESPVSSGSSSNSITSFSGYGEYKYSARINLRAVLSYDVFSSTFSGTGSRGEITTSSSHSITTISGGLDYMF